MRPQLYPPKKLNQAPRYGSRNTDWGAWPKRVEDSIDYHTANYCIKALQERKKDKPQFLACGNISSRTPRSSHLPTTMNHTKKSTSLAQENDWNDLPKGAVSLLRR